MDLNVIYQGNALSLIDGLPPSSVDTIITSPPYFNMRDLGIEGQVGQEDSLRDYIDVLLVLFNKAKVVLKPNGSLWLNLGDKYVAKELLGVPWAVAFDLKEDGWILKSEVIWDKMNRCLGGKWNDRLIYCHETLFLFTLQHDFYFDWEAIREKSPIPKGSKGGKGSALRHKEKLVNARPPRYYNYTGWRRKRTVWNVMPQPSKENHYSMYPLELVEPCVLAGSPKGGVVLDPFCGTGTTCLSAAKNGRYFIGFDINSESIEKTQNRLRSRGYSCTSKVL